MQIWSEPQFISKEDIFLIIQWIEINHFSCWVNYSIINLNHWIGALLDAFAENLINSFKISPIRAS